MSGNLQALQDYEFQITRADSSHQNGQVECLHQELKAAIGTMLVAANVWLWYQCSEKWQLPWLDFDNQSRNAICYDPTTPTTGWVKTAGNFTLDKAMLDVPDQDAPP